jgi:hypothetical protein
VHGLRSAARSPECPDGIAVRIDPDPPAAAGYALFFETGTYSFTDGAVRYRRGEGGRQPLTEAVLRRMVLDRAVDGFTLELAPDPDSLRRLSPEPRRLGLATLNGRGAP